MDNEYWIYLASLVIVYFLGVLTAIVNMRLQRRERTCKHINTEDVYICYQEGYRQEKCNDCNKIIYNDL